jgi:hypothetical protein
MIPLFYGIMQVFWVLTAWQYLAFADGLKGISKPPTMAIYSPNSRLMAMEIGPFECYY